MLCDSMDRNTFYAALRRRDSGLFADGLHPNDAGHLLMFENIRDRIEDGRSATWGVWRNVA